MGHVIVDGRRGLAEREWDRVGAGAAGCWVSDRWNGVFVQQSCYVCMSNSVLYAHGNMGLSG